MISECNRPRYIQDIYDANNIHDLLIAIKKYIRIKNQCELKKEMRKTDEAYRLKLCAQEKKKNIKRTELGLRNDENSKRRAQIYRAMPQWADKNKIKEIYMNAAELNKGLPRNSIYYYHVDHIIPLVAKNKNQEHIATGLHIHTNLQIILAHDNLKKGCIMPELDI